MIENLIMLGLLCIVVFIYFKNNPVGHASKFRIRCFLNWFPLGLTYAFLYMGRYNLKVSQYAFEEMAGPAGDPLMGNAGFNIGTATRLHGRLDVAALEDSLARLAERHALPGDPVDLPEP